MRALVITERGPPEVPRVQERPDPQPAAGEALMRVRAAGINFADAHRFVHERKNVGKVVLTL